MKPSLRFLTLAVLGWAGFRAASLDIVPDASWFRIPASEAKPVPPIVPTQFPALDPIMPEAPAGEGADALAASSPLPTAAAPPLRYVQAVVGIPVAMRRGIVPVYQLPAPAEETAPDLPAPRRAAYAPAAAFDYAKLPSLDDSPFTRLVGPVSRPAVMTPGQSIALVDPRRIDRLQLSTWALLRSQQGGLAGSRSLATGGQLGASQAGARLVYNLDRRLALAARMSSEVGRRGGEVAGGIRVHPLAGIPVWLTAERRQAIGKYGGGRDAFALFLEGGLYQRPLPWEFSLDAYLQGGVVGFRHRDLFVDGALAVSRPVYRNVSAGFGVWGGAQPGLYRVDVGPRVTMRVRNNLRVHLDWRQRVAGNARPGSGPALTLAGDF